MLITEILPNGEQAVKITADSQILIKFFKIETFVFTDYISVCSSRS